MLPDGEQGVKWQVLPVLAVFLTVLAQWRGVGVWWRLMGDQQVEVAGERGRFRADPAGKRPTPGK
jgi:hypothetical protein